MHTPRLLVVELPSENEKIHGLWSEGFVAHKGITEESTNYATVWAQERHIIPDQQVVQREYAAFLDTLRATGFELEMIPFPEEFNQHGNANHDAVFIRDAGMMFKDMWIKARYSVPERNPETDVIAEIISKRFNKQVVELPEGAYIEFGETFFLDTAEGTYYFGGLGRANKAGHDAVRDIVQPDNYILVHSEGYHLDTVLLPILSAENKLVAIVIAEHLIDEPSMERLRALNVELISIDPVDSSGTPEELGKYAINGIPLPGKMVNALPFETPGVEDRLAELGIERFHSILTYHRYAGGSYHCLTNEVV